MRRPQVYERTAPRAKSEATPQAARPIEVSRGISRSLPHMIDEARAAGLTGSPTRWRWPGLRRRWWWAGWGWWWRSEAGLPLPFSM